MTDYPLKFEWQINKAAADGDNDLAMNLAREQRDYYEYFGYGTTQERYKYFASKR